jgi:hypothetical protein
LLGMRWEVVLLLLGVQAAGGALYSLQDSWRPGLATGNGDKRMAWWGGGPAFVLASSGAVRLNFRGLFTYPPSSIVRRLDKGLGWHGIPCNLSAWSLCSSEVGHVFPASKPRMPERKEAVVVDGWNDLGCSKSDGKILVSLGVYDISACDVFDEGLDLLYTSGMLYHRHTAMPAWKYWTLVALSIVLVRCLSYNIQSLWLPPGEAVVHNQWLPLGGSLALLVLVLIDGDSIYVTGADLIFYWCTVGYVGLYLGIHGGSRAQSGPVLGDSTATGQYEQPVFNVIVGTLQLVAMRFYTAAETPYNTVLVAMLASRGWTKMLVRQHCHGASLVLDSLYLSLCIELAFDGTRELLVGVIGVAFMAGQLLANDRS